MNISEIETRTGLTRANVRFYEKEQLLAPVRKNNGYRDYSEDDIQTLLKIKLLRELGVSLDAIRSLQENPRQLLQVLETCLSDIHTESDRLRSASLICQAISASGASYDTLDVLFLPLLHSASSQACRRPWFFHSYRDRSAPAHPGYRANIDFQMWHHSRKMAYGHFHL